MPGPASPSLLLGLSRSGTRQGFGFAARHEEAVAPDAPITDDSESHCLVVAPTGAGKGRNFIIPNLLHWRGNVVAIDIKGEAAITTARCRRSLGQQVVILDPFERLGREPDALNPLDWLRMAPQHMADNAATLADTLSFGDTSMRDPFWDQTANGYNAGLIARAATHTDLAQRNLGAVHDVVTSDDPALTVATILDHEKGMHPYARRQLSVFFNHEKDKVRPSVNSTAQQHLRVFANPLVQKAVSRTTFSLAAFQRGVPMSIYLVLPATRLHSHAGLLRIWLAVLLGLIAERKAQPELPTLLVLDELAQIGGMHLILQALTLLRGYGVRVMAVLQSLGQLSSLWPRDYQTVLDNCGTVVTFGQNRPSMAAPMAALFGDVGEAALIDMRKDEVAISRTGCPSVFARKLDYLRDPMFAGRFDDNELYRKPAAHEAEVGR